MGNIFTAGLFRQMFRSATPVALAAMAGSAIAKSDPFKTGLNAVKLAIAAFIVPFIFVFNNKMLFIDARWYDILQIGLTSIVGMVGLGAALEGYFTRHAHLLQRVLFLAGGLLLIEPSLITDIIGILRYNFIHVNFAFFIRK